MNKFQLKHLKHEMINYFANLHTSLEIVTIKDGRFSEWLRENRPSIRMINALMHATHALFENLDDKNAYDFGLIALGHLRWYQGQQRSLPVAMRRVQDAIDAMYEAGWYETGESE